MVSNLLLGVMGQEDLMGITAFMTLTTALIIKSTLVT